MKIRIITSCTGEKLYSPETQLTQDDLRLLHDHKAFKAREKALGEYRTSAEDLYTGQQHVRLMEAVRQIRESRGPLEIELWILSAGYGLIPGNKKIVPYECTFQGMKHADLRKWAEHLRVPETIQKLFAEPVDLNLILLGDSYLKALTLNDSVEIKGPTLFLTSSGALKQIKGKGRIITIPLSNREAKRFSCGLVALKGELAKRILARLAGEGEALKSKLLDPACDYLDLFDGSAPASSAKRSPAKANPNVDRVIEIPPSWWQKPHREKLRYFIPEWDDLVDPDYDFETDTHSGGQGDWSNETYAHQMYPEPNYDGILISKVVAEKSKKKKERINQLGVHRYLRVPREFPIMGDCGAFGYIMDETPPYTTNEILDYYTRLDFDYGVSIDHLIVKATEEQKKFRYGLTIHNAEKFLHEHRKRDLQWEPIGAVQGWDTESYLEAARKYVAMGYKYIALGGLVRTHTNGILQILEEVHQVVPNTVKIHLFGIARFKAIRDLVKFGVRSIDSASMLRKAWLGSDLNFLTLTGWYSAIRIPQSDGSFRGKKLVDEGVISLEDLRRLENKCLVGLRKYAASKERVSEELVRTLVEYDTLVAGERKKTHERIQRTLEDRPWEACGCAICSKWGVEVAIFRGNNRNRRRGFHNTHVFYQLIERKMAGESINWLDDDSPDESQNQMNLFKGATA